MPACEFRVRVVGDVIVFDVCGHVDAEAARHLVEIAVLAVGRWRKVEIDLDHADSISDDAAAVLLFSGDVSGPLPEGISLRTCGHRSRQAVIEAYARHRTSSSESA